VKKNIIPTAAIIFFVIINTSYFWEPKLGFLAFPFFGILLLYYITLVLSLVLQVYRSIRERFQNKQRIVTLFILLIVTASTGIKPNGLLNFDNLFGFNLLVASAEGGGNCTTYLRINHKNRFNERIFCFGVFESKGTVRFKNDTIFFENVKLPRLENEFDQFAILKQRTTNDNKEVYYLERHRDLKDSIGRHYNITKIDIEKIRKNESTR
jgi:hypothetical protein